MHLPPYKQKVSLEEANHHQPEELLPLGGCISNITIRGASTWVKARCRRPHATKG
jgi:hypothetical protein